MEDEAGPSLPTANQEQLHEVRPQSVNNDTSNDPELVVPHEILQDVGAQNIFTSIEVSTLPGMALKTQKPINAIVCKMIIHLTLPLIYIKAIPINFRNRF
jgi:hypothetical protein